MSPGLAGPPRSIGILQNRDKCFARSGQDRGRKRWLRRAPSKSGFFWQGLAIVLPVIVLAGRGLVSLRNDRALARHEARERAQLLARICWPGWKRANAKSHPGHRGVHSFRIDPGGALLEPMPVAERPIRNRSRPSG